MVWAAFGLHILTPPFYFRARGVTIPQSRTAFQSGRAPQDMTKRCCDQVDYLFLPS